MPDSVSPAEFVILGQRLYLLMNATDASLLSDEIPLFLESLETCGLVEARQIAEPLATLGHIPFDRDGRATDAIRGRINTLVGNVRNVIYSEAAPSEEEPDAPRELPAEPEPPYEPLPPLEPTPKPEPQEENAPDQLPPHEHLVGFENLSDLENFVILTKPQKRLLSEVAYCYDKEAYRAAVAFAWELAFDCVRQWVFDEHRARFNSTLFAKYTNLAGFPLYRPVTCYEEFYSGTFSEEIILETCEAARLLTAKSVDRLRLAFEERNDLVRDRWTQPGPIRAQRYINSVVEVVLAVTFLG